MAFQKNFGGPPDQDQGGGPPVSGKKSKKPFGKKSFQKKGFTPAMKSMRGGGRY